MSFTETPRSTLRAIADGEVVDLDQDRVGGTLGWAQAWGNVERLAGTQIQWFDARTGDTLAERNELGEWTVYPLAESYDDELRAYSAAMNSFRD